MKLLEPVMWNSMKLTRAASDPMISLVPALLPAICAWKLNSTSCCSSSALFQSTVSGCKHKKKLRVQEDNNSFWLWVAKRKSKGENFTEP
jgi:hypothetical protein